MSCRRCSSPCQGGLCRQCEVELAWEHKQEELADGESSDGNGGTRPVPADVPMSPEETEGDDD